MPLVPSVTIVKNDNCNPNAGVVNVSATGGTGPYTYQVLPSSSAAPTATSGGWVSTSTFNLESIAPLTYTAYVKDANNCIQSVPVNLLADPIGSFQCFSFKSVCRYGG